jgi:Outer membrane protein and related peptidoglycan-associated (lipo)proteins
VFSLTRRSLRFFTFTLLMALLTLSGCQTAPQKGLTPAQIAVLKQQGFELTDEGWAFGLSGKVLFGSDDDSLNPASTDIVERIGKALLGVEIERVRVDGHTDASGKESYNEQLSLRRAKSVGKVLTVVGMKEQNILLRGLGSSEPVASNNTPAGPYREPPGVDRGERRLIGEQGLATFTHQQTLILLGTARM